ncbi:MAG: SPOR domain-containing protein [Chitinophagaceae bacterium]
MVLKILFCFFILFSFCAKIFAADTIIVQKDPRLDILSAKQAAINKVTAHMTSNGQYRGYRLQVLITRSRDEAFKIKGELLQNYPDQKTYVLFQSPNFKVRFGNFLERTDAEKYRKLLQQQFSNTIFVVEDAIDYIPKETDEQQTNE